MPSINVFLWFPTCSEIFITNLAVFSLWSILLVKCFVFIIFNKVSPLQRIHDRFTRALVNKTWFFQNCCSQNVNWTGSTLEITISTFLLKIWTMLSLGKEQFQELWRELLTKRSLSMEQHSGRKLQLWR